MTRHIPLLLLVVTLLGSATLGLSQTPENDAPPSRLNLCASSMPTLASCLG